MLMERPIIVLGFGRSGTTWISDIISKALGGLVLFEPLHPAVCDFAREVCYSPVVDRAERERLQAHLDGVLHKRHRDRWLLRNHLFSPLEEASDAFLNAIWDNCTVLGFKSIRGVQMMGWLRQVLDARIVYVTRHPCAVLASIRRRENFWKEFGWSEHVEMFFSRAKAHPHWEEIAARYEVTVSRVDSELEVQALMWSVTQLLAELQLQELGLPQFDYESFYDAPFAEAQHLLAYLGYPDLTLHPAHIFVPSMTTLHTVHGFRRTETDYTMAGIEMFWKGVLSQSEVNAILNIVYLMGVRFPLISDSNSAELAGYEEN